MIGRRGGYLNAVGAHRLEAELLGARAGDVVTVATRARSIAARVVSVDRDRVALAPFDDAGGASVGDRVTADAFAAQLVLGTALLGRSIDAFGHTLDASPAVAGRRYAIDRPATEPAGRVPISRPFWTGVRAIDGPLVFGRGARLGLFGSPGTGKSTLLESIEAGACADATVVALIGERGREAERWLRRAGGRTTVICATSDRSAAERLRAAEAAFAQADVLRSRGLHVLLVLDSLARVAAAARDLAVTAGEPVGRGGYPPSVAAYQARLLERAGATGTGSVTLIATVLSEGPAGDDPIAETARAALDGHIVLSRRLAAAGWFPAIDLCASVSRTLPDVATGDHARAAQTIRAAVAALEESREARALGLDRGDGDPALARAIALEGRLTAFLRQDDLRSDPGETLKRMTDLADSLK